MVNNGKEWGINMYYNTTRIQLSPEEVIDYLRKSRSDDPLLSTEEVLAKHEMELDEWAIKNLGDKVPEENKFREVVSGETLSERPEIQKVLKLIESPKYKAIKVVEPSRLTRGDLEDIGKIIKLLRYTETLVITPHKTYDLTDEYDREQFERELKRGNEYLEYTKKILHRGKVIAVKEGQYIGQSAPYGYKKVQYKEGRRTIKTLEFDGERAEVVKMMFDWYGNQGVAIESIKRRLNEMKIKPLRAEMWTRSAIHQILCNPVYTGKIRWQYRVNEKIVVNQEIIVAKKQKNKNEVLFFDGLHKPLISDELYKKVMERTKRNIPTRVDKKVINPFAGIMKCKKCGYAIKFQEKTPSSERRFKCTNTYCKSSTVLYTDLMPRFYEIMEDCIKDFEVKLEHDNGNEVEEHEKKIAMMEKKLKSLEQKELAQWEAQTDPDESKRMPASIFRQLNEKLVEEKKALKETLKEYYNTIPEKINYEDKIVSFKLALETLKDDSVDAGLKNAYLREIIEVITLDRDRSYRITKEQAEELGVPTDKGVYYFQHPFTMEITIRE